MPSEELNIPPKPDKYSNLWLGQLIDCVPENCLWLLRSLPGRSEYFCHIHQDTCIFFSDGITGGITCKEVAVSPEEAFRQALRAYEKAINK